MTRGPLRMPKMGDDTAYALGVRVERGERVRGVPPVAAATATALQK
ncbi:hypothetical protein [Streptomyces sp. TRM64462]|nr:hypothetical protein [Streptomyces sp. TRM64462]